jgi:hypothetical protein
MHNRGHNSKSYHKLRLAFQISVHRGRRDPPMGTNCGARDAVHAVGPIRSQKSVRSLSRFGGQLHHIKPRLPDIRDCAGRAIGMEIEDQILAGIVARPGREARAVRVAGLGKVNPIALRYPGDRLILGCRCDWRAEASGTQGAEHEGDFAAMRSPVRIRSRIAV